MAQFYEGLGKKKSARIRLAVMDMWKPFRNAAIAHAPQAAILFDKFHIMRHLGEALDKVRKSEYARLSERDRHFIKGQKYTLLSHRENLTLEGRQSLKALLAANKRTLREVRADDRSSLGWNRRLLPAREQGVARIRGRLEQQDSCHPAPRIWTAR